MLSNTTNGNKQTYVTIGWNCLQNCLNNFVFVLNATMAGVQIIDKHLNGPKILVTMTG